MPFEVFKKIAEERIREAIERGDFDNLELKGKPLLLKEDPFVPEELRAVFCILKNAGFLPREIELRREIEKLEGCLDEDHQEVLKEIKKLSALIFQLAQIKNQPLHIEEREYYAKVVEKIRLYKQKNALLSPEQRKPERINFYRLQVLLSVKSLAFKRR
ncbi:MAG: DUF1992 domain-containing protein [Caldimicrobium sp.]|nr:DUF1992 domain-containing protein [Caldimicrobium sp.]MCX7873788.1 DUF1992 domain-containing protein [Caldimicrobium sp.]MDW8094781.1 DUF1992 domain-containing protein [Caldimicrobium sp.]